MRYSVGVIFRANRLGPAVFQTLESECTKGRGRPWGNPPGAAALPLRGGGQARAIRPSTSSTAFAMAASILKSVVSSKSASAAGFIGA